jgi:hypothetical protein
MHFPIPLFQGHSFLYFMGIISFHVYSMYYHFSKGFSMQRPSNVWPLASLVMV